MIKDTSLRVLYICYLSLDDPLVQTQVVAYLEGLVQRGHTIHLLTFDGPLEPNRRASLEKDLQRRGIIWRSARYHKHPSLPATVFDTLVGALIATRLVHRYRLTAIHARNHVPAAMALIASRLTNCRLIFDVRGLMADEYVDAGRWTKGGLPYRLTTWIQRLTLRKADGVVMLTEAVRSYLSKIRVDANATLVIPCCADLERIERRSLERDRARAELGADNRPIMVYVGKLTGWYMEREMVEFFAVARHSRPDLLFLVVTQAEPSPMLYELNRNGIDPNDYRILRATPDEVGRWLAASDFAISFIQPCFSKISSSPTKIGEYLAAGLPVLSSAGIGDVDVLFRDNSVGVLITEFSESRYRAATQAIYELSRDPETRNRCKNVAHTRLSLRELGIPRYDELYRRVAASCNS